MSSEIWTYDSPGIVKMAGDLRTTYPVGTKVKLVQTTMKYFIIVASDYVSEETKLTLDGQGVYTLASETITGHWATTWTTPSGGFPFESKTYPGYDIIVYQNSGTIISKNEQTGEIIDSGTLGGAVTTRVLRAAITACPVDGSILIGPGLYDGLVADLLCSASDEVGYLHYYTVLPVTKNIHIKGSGIGSTILKLGAAQHSSEHPALIMYAYSPPVDGELQDGYTSFSLEDMTFDGNKANNTPANYDGAGLFLDGCMRYNGVFQNLEFQNSANQGLYVGYNGNGYANRCYYANIISHDNAGAGICFDTVRDSLATNLISVDDDASAITSGIGVWFMSASGLNSWNDDFQVHGINIHGSLFYLDNLRDVKITDLVIDSSSAASATSVKLYKCENVDIDNPTIRSGQEADHHGIDLDDSQEIRINGGLIDSNICIVPYAASTIYVNGTTLRSVLEIAYVSGISRLELLACKCEPTSGQYLLSVLDTSVVRALGCSSSVLAAYYIAATADFIQVGCMGMGDTGPASLYATVFLVGLGADRTTHPTYTAAYATYEGLVVNGYWASPAEEPYRYRRFIDLVALGYASGGEGGSVMRFLTNPATGCDAVEAGRFDRDGRLGVGEPAPIAKVTVGGDLAVKDGMTAPDASTGYAKIYVDGSGGALKVKFADSVVQTLASGTEGVSEHIPHSLATAENDFLVASGAGVFVKKTLAEVKTILGIGE